MVLGSSLGSYLAVACEAFLEQVVDSSEANLQAVGKTDVVPTTPEEQLKKAGGHYSKGDDWSSYVQSDKKLVTGAANIFAMVGGSASASVM